MDEDKDKKYKDYMNDKGKNIDATYGNFDGNDIIARNNLIIDTFINYLDSENLFK